MKCLHCSTEVVEGSRFCSECGAPVRIACPACHSANPAHAKFCSQCGAKLGGTFHELAEQPEHAPTTTDEAAERRHITVMFCDVVGSTELSSRLDPEDLRDVMTQYNTLVASTVHHYDGFVARYLGDGALVYFGYPYAHEDDVEQALRAALALIAAVGKLSAPERLQIRVGIATGLVVVGDQIGAAAVREQVIAGETPNLAARLQTLANPNEIIIAESTRKQIGALFDVEDLGLKSLKGFAKPQRVWRVLAENRGVSRFEALRSSGTTLIGRQEEMETLLRRWDQARAGSGRAVLISGEPGVGKSRLAETLAERISDERPLVLRFFCSPHHQDSALYSSITHLERHAGFGRDETQESRFAKLQAVLTAANTSHEAIALIADLLSVQTNERYKLPTMNPQRRREKTLAALLEWLSRLTIRQPLLVIYEDVHWIDPTSLELLMLAIDRWRALPILLLMTARPEFTAPWPPHAHVTQITLPRLDARETGLLVERVAEGKKFPAEVLEQIIARTDGIPLFAEELTKAVLESGLLAEDEGRYVLHGPLPPVAIPISLNDSLMARLDRLSQVREVAQIGSAIGRAFSYEVLRAIMAIPEDRLQSALRDLVQAELMFCRGVLPDAVYTFKHALVQDAAYQTMLKSRRIQLHSRIAKVLESSFPELALLEPETLARHFAAAARPKQAISYVLAAARRSLQRSAHKEAIAHLNAGITLLAEMPDGAARTKFEIQLCSTLGFAFTAIKGYAAPEVEGALSRAHELCQKTDEPVLEISVLRGLARFNWARGNLLRAKRFAMDLVQLAERTSDEEVFLVAHGMLAGIHHHMGEISASESDLAQLPTPRQAEKQQSIIDRFGEDLSSTMWTYHGLNLAFLGHLSKASAAAEDAVAAARRTGHAFSIANTLCRAALCPVILRDPARAAAFAEQALPTAEELGSPTWVAAANVLLGWASALDRRTEESVEQIRGGIALYKSTSTAAGLPLLIGLASEALLVRGDIAGALAAAEEGLWWSAENTECCWDCFLRIARADALLALGKTTEAEADYQQAFAWSRERNAKWGELYAGTRLVPLLRSSGRSQAARELLAPIYGWFTEGFNNAVLKEAGALLEELG